MRDDEWKNLRKILAPIFTSNKLKRMFELMKRCTKNLQQSIDSQGEREIDLKEIFSVFTVDVISTCCFSMDLKDFRHPDSEILMSARKFFNVSRMKMICAQAIPKSILSFIGFDINDVDSISFFQRFATEVINARRKISSQSAANHLKRQDDFLQTLIDAAAEFNGRNDNHDDKTPRTDTTGDQKEEEEKITEGLGQDNVDVDDNKQQDVTLRRQAESEQQQQQQQVSD